MEANKRKERIMNAAMEILKESPIEEATVRKIAAKAGLTTGAIYHHYKNKDELLFDVIKQSLQFTHRLAEAAKNEENPKQGKELVSEIVSEVTQRISKKDEQKLHIQLLSDVIAKESETREKYQRNYRELIDDSASLFERCYEIRNKEYTKAVASILVAAMDGIAMQQALGVLPESLDIMAAVFTSFFAESIQVYLERPAE